MHKKRLVDWLTLSIAVLALLTSLFIEYTHTDAANADAARRTESRVTALETRETDGDRRMDEIRSDVKDLNQKVDKLIEWALGGQHGK